MCFEKLHAMLFDWFKEECANFVAVQFTEIRSTTQTFAKMMDMPDFQASAGWLYKFNKRHGISNRHVMTENASVDVAAGVKYTINHFIQEMCLSPFPC